MVRSKKALPESFNEILTWLNPDREVAGRIYVQLRHDLTKIFLWNRCIDPESLTDEVFDRVATKVHSVRGNYEGDPRLFFYGVARNLIKESQKKIKLHVALEEIDPPANPENEITEETKLIREECLHYCLQKLNPEKRELILSYYAKEKQAKIDHRSEMARQQGISVETLRVRVYRIRSTLEQCIERCLSRRQQK